MAINIEPGTEDKINVLIEIPKGSQNKYEYDKEANVFKLDRVLFSPFHYPGDYGFVPNTLAKDGDPLDALVLVNVPTFPGCVIESRPIGVMHMVDSGEEDNKILCVPVDDPRMNETKDIKNLNKHVLDEIAHFFKVYKELEGKTVEVKGWDGVDVAKKLITESINAYKK